MITGFNTDVEHEGVVYHVQTEDKGLDTPLILSLVYSGGAILASKRARYDDLIAEGFDEAVLAERLQRQHKLMCAAIRSGRLEELKKMSEREAATRAAAKKAVSTESQPPPPPPPLPPAIKEAELPAPRPRQKSKEEARASKTSGKLAAPPKPKPLPQSLRVASHEPVADFARAEAATSDALRLSLIDEKNYRGGERINLRLRVERGTEQREPADGAEVIVKILGSTFRPLIFQTRTNPEGIAAISTQLPHFRSGRAAILIRATADGHEAELRRIIQQG
ncbi:MAG: hypothetical protein H7Y30_03295 [Pyrinomonadaceae bacterium]|nr:hypothetical protein [Pyrinomonadaceae bacterium]